MDQQTTNLAGLYGRYFVDDFVSSTMSMLNASYPLTPDILDKVKNTVSGNIQTPMVLGSPNAVTRFLVECAEAALQSGVTNPESREAWDDISKRPSIHHSEIQELMFNTASVYRQMVDGVLMGVIGTDVSTLQQTIVQGAQARSTIVETGGTIQEMDWGILNDGMWLNRALIKAYDRASIFRPGDPVVAFWASVAFSKARELQTFPLLSPEENQTVAIQVGELLGTDGETQLASAITTPGVLKTLLDRWERGLVSSWVVADSIASMSNLAEQLDTVMKAIAERSSDNPLLDVTRARLTTLSDVVTLCLAGYEVLRETKYADTVILDFETMGDDPRVNVWVNKDAVTAYINAGGELSELVRFGLYYDPRKGMPIPYNGYTVAALIPRRSDVMQSVADSDAARLQTLRNQDAAAIQELVIKEVNKVITSYLDAKNVTNRPTYIDQNVYALTRLVTGESSDPTALHVGLFKLLVLVLDDPLLTNVSEILFGVMPEMDAKKAIAYTIAVSAGQHIVSVISDPDMEESV